jgi:hypothetical protein
VEKKAETYLIHEHKSSHPLLTRTYSPKIAVSGGLLGDIKNRLQRYQDAKGWTRTIAQGILELEAAGQLELFEAKDPGQRAKELLSCGSFIEFDYYFTHPDKISKLRSANFCNQRILCPLCAIRRSAKLMQSYIPKVNEMVSRGYVPYMVTFTIKNGPDLLERYRHLERSMKLLMDRGKKCRKLGQNLTTQARFAFGAVGSMEFKRGKDSGLWHPHMHMIWFCDRGPDQRALSDEWREITGDSFIVDVRKLRSFDLPENMTDVEAEGDLISDLCEVFKYPMKFQNQPVEDIWHGHFTFKGKKFLRTYGEFYNLRVDESLLDKPLEDKDLPYVKLAFKYVKNAYKLRKSEYFEK